MAPPLTFAKTSLGYPLYEVDFDPYNRGYLVVGGGGGGGNAGVPNKLNLIDVSSRSQIESVAEYSLPKDDDSVASVASLATKDGLATFAGVSSPVADRQAGKNEHFRSFEVAFPKQTKAQRIKDGTDEGDFSQSGSIRATGSSRLFSSKAGTGKYTNQKLMRLSPVRRRDQSTRRVGAIASRDGEASEILLFDATKSSPDQSCVFARLEPEDGTDTQDLDIAEVKEGIYEMAYCTSKAIVFHTFEYDFSAKAYRALPGFPKTVYSKQADQLSEEFRCLRWTGPLQLLVASNNRASKRTELLSVMLPKKQDTAAILHRTRLPATTKATHTLDVCLLDADPGTHARQILAAAAGADGSIYLYSMTFTPSPSPSSSSARQMSKPRLFTTLNAVHDGNGICKVAFAPFFPPSQPAHSTTSVASQACYARLASVAIFADTVVVDTIALTSTPTRPSLPSDVKSKDLKKHPSVRWVLSSQISERAFTWFSLVLIAFVVLISAVVAQTYMATAGGDALGPLRRLQEQFSKLQAPGAIPPVERSQIVKGADKVERVREAEAAHPHEHHSSHDHGADAVRDAVEKAEQAIPPSENKEEAKVVSLSELLAAHREEHGADVIADDDKDTKSLLKRIIVRPHHDDEEDVHVSVHEGEDAMAEEVKTFEELGHEQKEKWKGKLVRAGKWTADEGEAVLKGVLFSQYAGVVGGAIRDAVLDH